MEKLLLFMFMIFISGCSIGPYYGSDSNYDSGKWWGFADQQEAAEYKLQKNALSGPGGNAQMSIKRLPGIAANDGNRKVTISFSGPEKISVYIAPGKMERLELFPGTYEVTMYSGGNIVGYGTLPIAERKHRFKGEPVNWYAVYSP